MNYEQKLNLFAVLLMIIVPSLPLHLWIRAILRIDFFFAGLISLGSNAVVFALYCWATTNSNEPSPSGAHAHLRYLIDSHFRSADAPVYLVLLMIAGNLAVALAMKLYFALFLGRLSPEEKTPGTTGFRAWGSPAKVLAVIAIAVCLYLALDCDYVGTALLGLAALLAYPLFNTVGQPAVFAAVAVDPMAPLKAPADERQRVLALVETGKITADDAAELLTALAQSQAVDAGASKPLSGARRVMLLGAFLSLIGFFLPWFTINISEAMRDATSSLQQNMRQYLGGLPPNFDQSAVTEANRMQVPVENLLQFSIRGGDVQHGLGWMILAAGLVGACLPFFWTPPRSNSRQMRNAVFAALAVGSVLALYVLSGSFNAATSIEPGFVLTIAGYAVLWVGCIREYADWGMRLDIAPAVV